MLPKIICKDIIIRTRMLIYKIGSCKGKLGHWQHGVEEQELQWLGDNIFSQNNPLCCLNFHHAQMTLSKMFFLLQTEILLQVENSRQDMLFPLLSISAYRKKYIFTNESLFPYTQHLFVVRFPLLEFLTVFSEAQNVYFLTGGT